jgi:LPS export ABC transporter protein LptC
MFARSYYWLPLFLLALVALLSFWLEEATKPNWSRNTNGLGEPDAIVENFHSVLDDSNGHPMYKLSASKFSYYGKVNETKIDLPDLQRTDDTDGLIRITAVSADVAPDAKSMVFKNNVKVIHTPPNAKRSTILLSQQIEADITRHLIISPTPTKISGPGIEASASSMELDTENRVLKLRGNVKVQYSRT